MSKEIISGDGIKFVVDDCDYAVLSTYKWHSSNGYAMARKRNRGKTVYMHRLIMGNPDGREVDHISRDKRDNRRDNLRTCTHSQNEANKGKVHLNTTSIYRGVSWNKRQKRWVAMYCNKWLGCFLSEEEAASCYNEYVSYLHPDFAILNPIRNF